MKGKVSIDNKMSGIMSHHDKMNSRMRELSSNPLRKCSILIVTIHTMKRKLL